MKEAIILVTTGILFFSFLIGVKFYSDEQLLNREYKYHINKTVNTTAPYAPATFDQAQSAVMLMLSHPERYDISVYTYSGLYALDKNREPGEKYVDGFDENEVMYKRVGLLLSKKDYRKYYKFIHDLSKPYQAGKKHLGPLVTPSWDF